MINNKNKNKNNKTYRWDKASKNGPSEICRKTAFKKIEVIYGLKGCLLQI